MLTENGFKHVILWRRKEERNLGYAAGTRFESFDIRVGRFCRAACLIRACARSTRPGSRSDPRKEFSAAWSHPRLLLEMSDGPAPTRLEAHQQPGSWLLAVIFRLFRPETSWLISSLAGGRRRGRAPVRNRSTFNLKSSTLTRAARLLR